MAIVHTRVKRPTFMGYIMGVMAPRLLYKYQLDWLRAFFQYDYLGILGSRQIGKDFTFEFAFAAILATQRDCNWNIMSATNLHAKGFMNGIRRWLVIFREFAELVGADFPVFDTNNARQIISSWGCIVTAVSNKVSGTTGMRGGVFMNEVPLIETAKEVYGSAITQVDMALGYGKFAKMVMLGNASPLGTFWANWFMDRRDLAARGKGREWYLNTTTWVDAQRANKKSEKYIQFKKKKILETLNNNQAALDRWYMCEFVSMKGGFFDYELIDKCLYDPDLKGHEFHALSPQVIGYDIGRTNDPSAFAPLVLHRGRGFGLMTSILKQTSFPAQRAYLKTLANSRVTNQIVFDSTGIGGGQRDELRMEMPVSVFDYSLARDGKINLFMNCRSAMQAGRAFIHRGDVDLQMHLSALESAITDKDRITLTVPNIKGEHSDRAVAYALAVMGMPYSQQSFIKNRQIFKDANDGGGEWV